jgi:hypothetical protein
LRRGRGQFPLAVPKLPVNASPLRPKICKCRLARRAHDLNFQKFLRLSISASLVPMTTGPEM